MANITSRFAINAVSLLHHLAITRSGDVFCQKRTGLLCPFLETYANVECFFKLSDIHNAIDTIAVTNPGISFTSPTENGFQSSFTHTEFCEVEPTALRTVMGKAVRSSREDPPIEFLFFSLERAW